MQTLSLRRVNKAYYNEWAKIYLRLFLLLYFTRPPHREVEAKFGSPNGVYIKALYLISWANSLLSYTCLCGIIWDHSSTPPPPGVFPSKAI